MVYVIAEPVSGQRTRHVWTFVRGYPSKKDEADFECYQLYIGQMSVLIVMLAFACPVSAILSWTICRRSGPIMLRLTRSIIRSDQSG
jgi:hypothetical protein